MIDKEIKQLETEENTKQRKLVIDKSEVYHVLHELSSVFNVEEIINNVEKKSEYVVQIPIEFQKQYESGEYWIMNNKTTGVTWPVLCKKSSNGRQEIVTPLSIKKEEFINKDPIKDVSNQYQNMILERQLNNIKEVVEKTLERVKYIEQGQKGDRIALMESGKQQILLALNQKDERSRTHAIQLGIHDISNAQNQFLEEIKNRCKRFKYIPRNKVSQVLIGMKDTSYLDDADDDYNELIQYFILYASATEYMSSAYLYLGDISTAELVYDIAIDNIKKVDFSRVRTIKYIHKNIDFLRIYEPIPLLKKDKINCLENKKSYDYIELNVSGEKLLEVINNDRK